MNDFKWKLSAVLTLQYSGIGLAQCEFCDRAGGNFERISLFLRFAQCAKPIPEYCNVSTADNFHLKPFIDDL